MNTSRNTARIVGTLFLTAMVTSLLGGGILESILGTPDYLAQMYPNKTQVVLGVLLELINAIAVVGIAVTVFPIFKHRYEALALGYLGFRLIEAVMQIAADVVPLSLLPISQEYLAAGAAQAPALSASGAFWLAARSYLLGTMLGLFFSLGALLFYTILYRTKYIPRWLSVWGLIGAVLILTWNLLDTFGISIPAGMALALPMILNEIFLGIWLIAKGFDGSAIAFQAAKPAQMNSIKA